MRRLVCVLVVPVLLALGAARADEDGGAVLWRWTDADGVVRYSPDRGRVPGRFEAVRVEPGMPMPPPPARPTPSASSPGTGVAADPFNDPARARAGALRGEELAGAGDERAAGGTAGGAPAPAIPGTVPGTAVDPDAAQELEPRIRELEAAIARDEEALKELISQPAPADGPDPLLESDELREIARRLPELQADLAALRERQARLLGR